ncbi:MAG: 50S ribosomal protein L21 [Actinobacteria bacterium]|nr:MAG: 50S ribosomal protein L21 [Actinomycetota bacterium]
MATKTQSYAIIALGGKQYVVREGERLLVDRLGTDEGKTFHPGVLFVGGEGTGQLAPSATVTARVVGHVRGEKVRIGKRRPKSGYRRQTGFRAALSQIEIESIGAAKHAATAAPVPKQDAPAPKPKEPVAEPKEAVVAQPPRGYADFTVVEIGDKAKRWKLEQLEAALEYENEHAKRKGAITALESAIEAKQEKGT